MSDEACKQCRFVREQGKSLMCHRRAPQVLHMDAYDQSAGKHAGYRVYSDFPIVQPDMWCGEFEPEEGGYE